METSNKPQAGKKKVKSGCRTCKIRKVKCDEDRPTCRRCTSTGRDCDGYGIWGGGESYHSRRKRLDQQTDCRVVTPLSKSVSVLALSPQDNVHLEWFKCRTSVKLPGTVSSGFWDTLLFQACLSEPAVLHAVLALSSVTKRNTVIVDGQAQNRIILARQEHFALQHYVKAISHLRTVSSIQTIASSRVPLITCLVFVCLELLRGHFETAQVHLQNGLKVLRETREVSQDANGIFCVKLSDNSTDSWIIEVFSRLHFQRELLKQTFRCPRLILQIEGPRTLATSINSIKDAWEEIVRLWNRVFSLSEQYHKQAVYQSKSRPCSIVLLEQQHRIEVGLTNWYDMFEVFDKARQGQRSVREETIHHLLRSYHIVVGILSSTCLQPDNECVFDAHTDRFLALLHHMIIIGRPLAMSSIPHLPRLYMDMSRSITDVGWIPPLYYLAVKCRVHRLRLQAIRLLEITYHREGFWDAQTAVCVAKKVMEIEERDFYKNVDTLDNFSLTDHPTSSDLSLPTLPESFRIREVEMVLLGSPMDTISLFGRQRMGDENCRVLLSKYNVHSQCWNDQAPPGFAGD